MDMGTQRVTVTAGKTMFRNIFYYELHAIGSKRPKISELLREYHPFLSTSNGSICRGGVKPMILFEALSYVELWDLRKGGMKRLEKTKMQHECIPKFK
jgi:hypothetical protein